MAASYKWLESRASYQRPGRLECGIGALGVAQRLPQARQGQVAVQRSNLPPSLAQLNAFRHIANGLVEPVPLPAQLAQADQREACNRQTLAIRANSQAQGLPIRRLRLVQPAFPHIRLGQMGQRDHRDHDVSAPRAVR